jgi:uncharacterized protein YecE (DUF72 family)
MKRSRDDGSPTARQFIEERNEGDKLVRNSPYGSLRSVKGWGSPFQKPVRCVVEQRPSIHIGISSLNGVPGKDRDMGRLLEQYRRKFNALEHCNPYHRMGDEQHWRAWGKMVENSNFIYAVKANQYLTHTRMLQMDEELDLHMRNFFEDRCPMLGTHLGPVLLQLPPQFHMTSEHLDRIRAVASRMPSFIRVAVEFRHRSWFCEEAYGVLRSCKWALVVTHNEDIGESPVIDTGVGFMYVRLHGAVGRYVGDYGPVAMEKWADEILRFTSEGHSREVYFFFNNNESHINGLCSSVVDATCLAEHLSSKLCPKAEPGAPHSTDPAVVEIE